MSWRIYVILILFALFFIILIFNPNLSCFGRRIRSPFYPLFHRKKKEIKTEDYGFTLVDEQERQRLHRKEQKIKIKGYELSADEARQKAKKKALKIDDYGFSLVDDQNKKKDQESKK